MKTADFIEVGHNEYISSVVKKGIPWTPEMDRFHVGTEFDAHFKSTDVTMSFVVVDWKKKLHNITFYIKSIKG